MCERDGVVVGLLLGYVTTFSFGDDKLAQDIVLFIEPTARGGVGALRMIERYVAWAQEKGCVEVQLGESSGANPELVDKLFTHAGFKQIGQLYRRRIT